jgi:hypothetical protein
MLSWAKEPSWGQRCNCVSQRAVIQSRTVSARFGTGHETATLLKTNLKTIIEFTLHFR